MASALSNLELDNSSKEMKKKASDRLPCCSLCKDNAGKASENPFHVWLSMDTRIKEKHLKHLKNCILAPILFGKQMHYSSKNIRWLRDLRLIPKTNFERISPLGTKLSNRLIEVAELAEEIVDTVFSCIDSDEFLHSSHHTYKELQNCSFVWEALSVGKRSEFVTLMSCCFNDDHRVHKQGIILLSLSVLHQAMKYICQTCKPCDYLTKFEKGITRKEQACRDLRLRGNDHFAAGDYHMAVAFYSKAVMLSPFDPLLYGNRAQSFLKLKHLREALSDAKRTVCLNRDWEKGHYRFAQAYFELGLREKAIAVNSLAQKCCSSTLNLLHQSVAFKKEMEKSAATNTAHHCSSSEEQAADKGCRHHQASCGNPCSSRTKVGSKRNWKLANENSKTHVTASSADSNSCQLLHSVRDCATAVLVDEDDKNCESHGSNDDDADCELSHHDSMPSLTFDSSDDDDDMDLCSEDSDISSLPSLASLSDLDTDSESDCESDWDSDGQLPSLYDSDECCCSDFECTFCSDDDDDDEEEDFEPESEDDEDDDHSDDDDDDDGNAGAGGSDFEDFLNILMPSPVLSNEVNPFGFVRRVLNEFFRAHPEMRNEGSPPALPEVIESLPKVKVTKDQVAINLSCAICQSDYEQDESVLELPCTHLFHPPCITTWLKLHATCPTCRDVLPH